MAELDLNLRNQVRFIWFSGEEQGLFGSTFNADGLTKAERGNVIAMLDFDMLASDDFQAACNRVIAFACAKFAVPAKTLCFDGGGFRLRTNM